MSRSNPGPSLMADYAPTPRYVTVDESVPAFDYVVIGAGEDGLLAALALSTDFPNRSVLIIEASKDDESIRVLPVGVALCADNHDLVNRSLTEWTAQLLDKPVVPQLPDFLDQPHPSTPTLISLNENHHEVPNNEQNLKRCQKDLDYWTKCFKNREFERGDTDQASVNALVESLILQPNVTFLTGTEVTMINYKQKFLGTRKMRLKFNYNVVFAASLRSLIPDLSLSGDAQPSIRFYPPLPTSVLDATKDLGYVPFQRTQLSFKEPFWQKKIPTNVNTFYLSSPIIGDRPIRMTVMKDNLSLEMTYTDHGKALGRRPGKNVYTETSCLLLALSGAFDVTFLVDGDKQVYGRRDLDHLVETLGVRHVSSKSNYARSIYLYPNRESLISELRAFQSSETTKERILFLDTKAPLPRPDTTELSNPSKATKVHVDVN